LIVLDLTLPEMDGLEVCRRLREDPGAERIPVIVLSARASESDRVTGLEIGADDYLIKPFSPRELLARVRAVLRRASIPQPVQPVLKIGDLEFDFVKHRVTFGGDQLALTPTEFRVLATLATQPGRTFSRDELTEAALRKNAGIADRAIDVHINKIREVLGPAADRIETVRGIGYRFRGTA